MVRVTVKLVGSLRHALGRDTVVLEFDHEPTLAEIMERLSRDLEGFSKVVDELKRRGIEVIAVADGVGLKPDTRVGDGVTVYIMPPTSGG